MFDVQRFTGKSNLHDKSAYVHQDRSLIYFKGTPPHLGCTILLFGDTLENLQNVKQCLQKMIHKARDVILESLFLTKINCNIQISDPDTDTKEIFLANQNIFLDSPKFVCRMHMMRINRDIERFKLSLKQDESNYDEKTIKRNLNEMCVIPRKKVFIAYDKDKDRTIAEILLEILENYGLLCDH
jgi:hypothetical protein